MATASLNVRPRPVGASTARTPQRLLVSAVATGVVAPPPQPRTRAPGLLDRVLGGGGTTPTDSDARQRRVAEPQRTGTQLLPWFSKPAQTPEVPVELRETARQPILSFAGGGEYGAGVLGGGCAPARAVGGNRGRG